MCASIGVHSWREGDGKFYKIEPFLFNRLPTKIAYNYERGVIFNTLY